MENLTLNSKLTINNLIDYWPPDNPGGFFIFSYSIFHEGICFLV